MAVINYVKFLRGTPTAYSNLAEKDNNTLYFISEKNSTSGQLYLGNRLISGGGTGGSGVSTLAELTDVITNTVQDKQLLVYDATAHKWKNGFISDIIDAILDSNVLQVIEGQLSLVGFDAAPAGSVAVKGSDGKIQWSTGIYTKDEVNSLLAGRLQRTKVNSVSDIDTSAADAESKIYMVPKSDGEGTNLYDEYVVIDGAIELIGKSSIDPGDYVTHDELNTALDDYVLASKYASEIGDIADLIADDGVDTVIGQVNVLTGRLTWNKVSPDDDYE